MERIKTMTADKDRRAAGGLPRQRCRRRRERQVFGVRKNEISLYSQPRPIRSVHRSEGWTLQTLAEHGMPALAGSSFRSTRHPKSSPGTRSDARHPLFSQTTTKETRDAIDLEEPARVGLAVLGPHVGEALAQAAWPVKADHSVDPWAAWRWPGRGRAFTEPMSKELGQPMVLDFKPGAGGALAAGLVGPCTGGRLHGDDHHDRAAVFGALPVLRCPTTPAATSRSSVGSPMVA